MLLFKPVSASSIRTPVKWIRFDGNGFSRSHRIF